MAYAFSAFSFQTESPFLLLKILAPIMEVIGARMLWELWLAFGKNHPTTCNNENEQREATHGQI